MNEFGFTVCPICKAQANIGDRDHQNWLLVKCERCGKYEITQRAAILIESIEREDQRVRSKLQYWIYAQNEQGIIPKILTRQIRDLVTNINLPTPGERVDILKQYLSDHINLSSDILKISVTSLQSMLGASEWSDVSGVVGHLENLGLIKSEMNLLQRPTIDLSFNLTVKGWEELKQPISKDESKLLAVVFTDIVGFTNLSSIDAEKAQEMLKVKTQIVHAAVKEYRGRVIKGTGDGFLIVYNNSKQAVLCCIKIQQLLFSHPDFKVRIGINQGDVVMRDNDVFGPTVNLAQRIESKSPEGGIAISNKVQADVESVPDIQTQSIGSHVLKGLKPVELFEVISHDLPHTT